MSLPDFICIGAQKAGTTWLYSMLAQHPSMWMPPLKELHYFSAASSRKSRNNPSDLNAWGPRFIAKGIARRLRELQRSGKPVDDSYVAYLQSLVGPDVMTEAWYRRVFSHQDAEGKVKCEITPAYLAIGDAGVAYAKSLLGAGKVLVIVREPVSRLISQVKMGVIRTGVEFPTDDVWKTVMSKAEKSRRGEYSDGIPLWQSYFGERMLVVPFGDIKTRPEGLIREIESFVDIQHFPHYELLNEQVHKTKEIEVPEWVRGKIEAMMKPQQEFILQHFGEAFFERTR